jgi:ferredoxin-NADP reductase
VLTPTPAGDRLQPGTVLPERELLVRGYEIIAKDVVLLTLADNSGLPLPEWEPGAHVELILNSGITRQYSLCSDPEDRLNWQIAVLREPASRGGSEYIHEKLLAGSRVRVRGPRNNFPLVQADRYLFIAGGIGITPIVPMVDAARAAGAEWTLLYGGRSRETMAFTGRLASAASASFGGRVDLRPEDETGLLDLASYIAELEPGTHVYCCGPEPLLKAIEETCASHHVGSLHVERFRAAAEGGPAGRFQIELRRSGKTLTVEADQTILGVLEQAGVEVLSSCSEGTCGTCLTTVLEGTPDHRDTVLTEAERASCKEILPCISRSVSPVLVLDL